MKRFVLAVGMLAFLAQLTGCGGGGPPGTTAAGVPSEVEEYEKRREMERAKGIVPKAPPPGAVAGPGGFAPK
jgi:predicted small lipoprotein YifL